MIYKYVSMGMCLGGGKGGKVSYLHEKCAIALNTTLEPKAKPTKEVPPQNTKCPYCGKEVGSSSELSNKGEAEK